MNENHVKVQGYLVDGVYVDANGIPIEEKEQTVTEPSKQSDAEQSDAVQYLNDLHKHLAPILSGLNLDAETDPGDLVTYLHGKLIETEKIRDDQSTAIETAGAERVRLESEKKDLTTERDGLKAKVQELEKMVADLKKAAKDAKDKGAPAAPAAATPPPAPATPPPAPAA